MLQSPSDARRVLGLDRIPNDLRVVARLLILWVDESEEDRARSLSAELRAPIRGLQSRRSEVRPLESRPMMRAPEATVAIDCRGNLSPGWRANRAFQSLATSTVRIAYQRNSSFPSDSLALG